MGNTRKTKKRRRPATEATCAVTKLIKATQNEDALSSDSEALSRTDRFFITSMLGDGSPSRMLLSEDTIMGGSSVGSIMERGRCDLDNDLKLQDPFQSLHIVHLLNSQKIAWQCFDEVQKNRNDLQPEASISDTGSRQLTTLFSFMIGWRAAGPNKILSPQASAFLFHLHPICW